MNAHRHPPTRPLTPTYMPTAGACRRLAAPDGGQACQLLLGGLTMQVRGAAGPGRHRDRVGGAAVAWYSHTLRCPAHTPAGMCRRLAAPDGNQACELLLGGLAVQVLAKQHGRGRFRQYPGRAGAPHCPACLVSRTARKVSAPSHHICHPARLCPRPAAALKRPCAVSSARRVTGGWCHCTRSEGQGVTCSGSIWPRPGLLQEAGPPHQASR